HQSILTHEFNFVFGDLGLIAGMVSEFAEYPHTLMRAQVEDASGVPFISPDHPAVVIHQDKVIPGYPQSDRTLCLRIRVSASRLDEVHQRSYEALNRSGQLDPLSHHAPLALILSPLS